jgi:subtilase family serine protease
MGRPVVDHVNVGVEAALRTSAIANSRSTAIVGGVSLLATTFLFASIAFGEAQAPDRIKTAIDSSSMVEVEGNVSPSARPENDKGEVEGSFQLNHLTLMLRATKAQESDLTTLLHQQQDKSSRNYHHWLTPDQYANRFGLSRTDLEKIASWLEAQGFTVDQTARSRTWIAFSGTAGQVEAAFRTRIHHYLVGGEMHYANTTNPSVPAALADVVAGIRSLNDFRMKPVGLSSKGSKRPLPIPYFTTGTGAHALVPVDIATIYDINSLYNSGIDGEGLSIAVMGQTDISLTDIEQFRQVFGLPPNDPTVVLVPGSADPGTANEPLTEADLDLEWSGAAAPAASILYVNSTNVADSFAYTVDQALAPVASLSFGACEPEIDPATVNGWVALTQQATAEGMTILAGSGDTGAAGCDTTGSVATHGLAVALPASLPFVTAIGGTEFNEGSGNYWNSSNGASGGSVLSYIPEIAWNDTAINGTLAASGGGASVDFQKPSWQVGSGVPNDNARDVPDVALSSSGDHDPYLICTQGSCGKGQAMPVGGTSVATPIFAGVLALIDQLTGSAQGNINPILYVLAQQSPSAFHDIMVGNNQVPCQQGTADCPNGGEIGYSAGPGYDQVTGLGSVDAYNLAMAWPSSSPPSFQLSVSPSSLVIGPGSSGAATLTITAMNGFSGQVQFTCSVASSLAATTCSVSPQSVNTSGYATLSITAAAGSSRFVRRKHDGFGPWLALLFLLAAGSSAVLFRRKPHATRYAQPGAAWARCGFAFALLAICLVAFTISCGGGGTTAGYTSSTPAQAVTGNVTLQAVSGNLSAIVQIPVTVN